MKPTSNMPELPALPAPDVDGTSYSRVAMTRYAIAYAGPANAALRAALQEMLAVYGNDGHFHAPALKALRAARAALAGLDIG